MPPSFDRVYARSVTSDTNPESHSRPGPPPVGADMPAPPAHYFASDNAAGAHTVALDAIRAANEGSAVAYGADPWSASAIAAIRGLFDCPAEVLFTYGGTGGNVVALGSLADPHEAIVCTSSAHIHVDECGAPERIAGTKLFPVVTPEGKLRPEDVESYLPYLGDPHHPQPRVVAISNSTEDGKVYSVDEIRSLAELAHAHAMYLFIDGARLANATAALGVDVAEFTTRAGVDAVVMGGTKAGLLYGEAVVFLTPGTARRAEFVRKASAQLASKQRFISAQFQAMVESGHWLQGAAHANRLAGLLWSRLTELDGIDAGPRPQANALFPRVPSGAIDILTGWTPFWVWDEGAPGDTHKTVRWMTSWMTTAEDVDRMTAGVAHALSMASAGEQGG